MNIGTSCSLSGSSINTEDLLSYLSQVVLTMTDEEARKRYNSLEEKKKSISAIKENFIAEKEKLSSLLTELSRQKALGRVLSTLDTLRREGVFTGQNRTRIRTLLENLDSKDFHYLRDLEERLGVYLT